MKHSRVKQGWAAVAAVMLALCGALSVEAGPAVKDGAPSAQGLSDSVKKEAAVRPKRKRAATPPRSPFLMPGEQLSKPIPATRLDKDEAGSSGPMPSGAGPTTAPASTSAPGGQTAGPIIPWTEAGQHVGQTITVEGTVVVARKSGKVCFLNFTKDWKGKFYVILFADAMSDMREPADRFYLNKTIRVTGEVSMRKDSPQMQVERASQIRVMAK